MVRITDGRSTSTSFNIRYVRAVRIILVVPRRRGPPSEMSE